MSHEHVTIHLTKLKKEAIIVLRATEKAVEVRKRILIKIKDAVERLKSDSTDLKAKRSLITGLNGERRFIHIIEKGIKSQIGVLAQSLEHVEGYDKSSETAYANAKALSMELKYLVSSLIRVMNYTRKKIRIVRKRVNQTEKLEKIDTFNRAFGVVIRSIEKEGDVDTEIANLLKGDLPPILLGYSKLVNGLKVGLGASIVTGVLATTVASMSTAAAVQPNESGMILLSTGIIAVVLGFISAFTHEEISIALYERGV